MGRKSSAKKTLEAEIIIQAEYSKNGIEEITKSDLKGSGQVLVSLALGLVHTICEQAGVKYTELLSNEIKRVVYTEAVEKAEKLQKEEEEKNGR